CGSTMSCGPAWPRSGPAAGRPSASTPNRKTCRLTGGASRTEPLERRSQSAERSRRLRKVLERHPVCCVLPSAICVLICMERTIGRTVIRVERGDITTMAVDAIVNAANNHLWMGGGVAGAIKRVGGAEIERQAVEKGPIEPGEAVVTGAGRLRCRYVIHAATMGQDLVTSADLIRRATRSSLRRANDVQVASIAFPALGTGVGGFPVREAAQIMVDEIAAHLRGTTPLRTVVLVVQTGDAEQAFGEALKSVEALER